MAGDFLPAELGINMNLIEYEGRWPRVCKNATVGPYGRAQFFRDCARFRLLNPKMHNLPLFYLFWISFQFPLVGFLPIKYF